MLVTYYAACCSGLPAPRAAAANRESLNLTYYERRTDLQCGFLSVLFGHQCRMDVTNFVKIATLCAVESEGLLDAPGHAGPAPFTPITMAEILSLVSTQILETTTINSSPITE